MRSRRSEAKAAAWEADPAAVGSATSANAGSPRAVDDTKAAAGSISSASALSALQGYVVSVSSDPAS